MAFYNQLQDITLLAFFLLLFVYGGSSVLMPEATRAIPDLQNLLGHLHLLGANKILHHTLGAMADKYGPIFSLQLGIHNILVVSSWEAAKECLTTQDKAFSNRPKSLAIKIMGYDHTILGFLPYGPYWRDMRKLAIVELLSIRRLDMLKHVRESEVNISIRELAMNIVVRMVAGKRYFGTRVHGVMEMRSRGGAKRPSEIHASGR